MGDENLPEDDIAYRDLETAAFHNNKDFILLWLQNADYKKNKNFNKWSSDLLRRAAYLHSVDVVECIVSYGGHCAGIVNSPDINGKTPLHCATEGIEREDIRPVRLEKDLLNIIHFLFQYGADPFIKSKAGQTPRESAVAHNFKLGAALLEILERIWMNTYAISSTENICLHKELLQWAVRSANENVITCILRMNISSIADPHPSYTNMLHLSKPMTMQDKANAQFLLGVSEGSRGETLIHVAANIGNLTILEAFIKSCGLPLNALINQRYKKMNQPIEQTPLSITLAHPSCQKILELFVKLQAITGSYITHIDLSNTLTICLPKELFTLRSIYKLDVSANMLKEVPFDHLSLHLRPGLLSDLDLSNNELTAIPIDVFGLPNLKVLNVSKNPLGSLPEQWWSSRSLTKLNASETQLTQLCVRKNVSRSSVSSVHVHDGNSFDGEGCQLKELNIANCKFDSFPKYLACYFPNLTHLNISQNNITLCCAVNELPALLIELNISNNKLHSPTFHLSSNKDFVCLRNDGVDCSLKCPHVRHNQLPQLGSLNLSDNKTLKDIVLFYEDLKASSGPTYLFFPKLKKLMIKNCGLTRAPAHLSKMNKIYYLDVSYNDIKVPREICSLRDLCTFNYDGLPDPVVADLRKFKSLKDQQMFLMQENAKLAPSLKLMFVGLGRRGKTTLFSHLKYGGKMKSLPVTFKQRLDNNFNESEIRSTVGIDQELWCYAKSMDEEDECQYTAIAFYAWDFAGQEEYSAAHQCFITDNSLYVLCWRASDGEQGIHELKDWLLTIKARAKSSVVVIVGTHVDQVKNFRKEKHKFFVSKITELYDNPSCYPPIKAITFVCCDVTNKKYKKYEQNIMELRDYLYDIASEIKLSLSGDKRFEQKVINMMVPEKYLKFQERIHSEASYCRLHREKRPPILSWSDIIKLGKDCGFTEEHEIAVAVMYVKEQGTLVHFDSVALKDLYFVDSQWLCDMFAHVVSSEYNTNFVNGEKANRQALEISLKEKFKISEEYMEPIITLFIRFELAIPLNKNVLLIPSLLKGRKLKFSTLSHNFPRKRAGSRDSLYSNFKFSYNFELKSKTDSLRSNYGYEINANRQRCSTSGMPPSVLHSMLDKQIKLSFTGMCFRRVFGADHIPANFWPRLIARFLSSVESYHKIILNNCFTEIHYENYVDGSGCIGGLKCEWSYGKNHVIFTLGESDILRVNGLYSFYNGSKRVGINITDTVDKVRQMQVYHGSQGFKPINLNDGFEVTIPDYIVNSGADSNNLVHESDLMSAQILSRVLETIDEVLKDWFEGLLERGIYSDKFLTHFIPCPFCFGDDVVLKDVNDSDDGSDDGSDEMDDNSSESIPSTNNKKPVGFSVQYCLSQARKFNYVDCPNHTDLGKLPLKYLAPDLVFEDIKFNKIDKQLLDIEKHPLGEGGFGAVYKATYLLDPPKEVALKCFTKESDENNETESTLQELSQTYADVRSEFNKLVSIDHPGIVKCMGFCVISLSFVLELAPLGNLKGILKNYRRTGYFICPRSLVDTVKQVSSALDYLHTKQMIAHYDIKPDNILVFRFPRVGHNCYATDDNDFTCISSKVEVKLADLGIAAYVGPGGFRRKSATPGHTAPEAIKYAGKESLCEKVDIFSLGITLYELMTLRTLPPPGVSSIEFDSDIKDGIRPRFLDEDPEYPIILKELVVNCWAQEYAARPSAEEILSTLQSPNCLKLTNVHNTELPYSAVCSAVVVTVDDQQSLWLAYKSRIDVYKFNGPNSTVEFIKAKVIDVKDTIKAMCRANLHVYVLLECGKLLIINTCSFKAEHLISKAELDKKDLIEMITTDEHSNLVTLAYRNGMVVFIKSSLKFNSNRDIGGANGLGFGLRQEMNFKHENLKLFAANITSPYQLFVIEACKPRGSEQVELWCGCDNGIIEIFVPHARTSQVQLKSVLETHTSSRDIPQDAGIIQLRSSVKAVGHMYALHNQNNIISCWKTGEQPVLIAVVKPAQLSSPANTIFPLKDNMIIADKSGKVYEFSLNRAIDGVDSSCTQLSSCHLPDTMIKFYTLYGKMNPQGFLSSIGEAMPEEAPVYVNIFNVGSPDELPCQILLGLKAGYGSMLHPEQIISPSLHFTTWAFIDNSRV